VDGVICREGISLHAAGTLVETVAKSGPGDSVQPWHCPLKPKGVFSPTTCLQSVPGHFVKDVMRLNTKGGLNGPPPSQSIIRKLAVSRG
jgi:hypothetical protein